MSTSGTDDDSACQVCADFEPQAWRKSLCRNCFHSLDEHSHDLLAAEAEAVAKEIALKEESQDKAQPGKSDPKGSSTANAKVKDAGKATPWSKDSLKSAKTNNSTSKSNALSTAGSGVPPKSSPKSTQSTPSSKSSSSSLTTTTNSSSTSSTSSKVGTTSSSLDTSSKSTNISKAKSLSSKFEAKAASSVSDKSSKTQESPKATDSSKLPPKTEPKTKHSVTNPKTLSKSQASEQTKAKEDVPEKKEATKSIGDGKDRKASLPSKLGDKIGKDLPNNRRNSAPFGKDMLRSTKEVLKKETKSSDTVSDKTKAKEGATDASKSTASKNSLVNEKEKMLPKDKTPVKAVKSLTEEKGKKKPEEVAKDSVKASNKATDKTDANDETAGKGTEHTNSTGTKSVTSTGKKVIAGAKINNGENNASVPGKPTHTNSSRVGEISDKTSPPATENESRDVTPKVEKDKKDIQKPIIPPAVSNKLPDNDKSGLYKDRGKDEGGGGDNGLTQPARCGDASPALTAGQVEGDTDNLHTLPTSSISSSSVTSSSPVTTTTTTSSSPAPVTSTSSKQAAETKQVSDLNKKEPSKVDKRKTDSGDKDVSENGTGSKSEDCDKTEVGDLVPKSEYDTLTRSLEQKDERFRALEEQVYKMESDIKKLEEEKQNLQEAQISARKTQKDDMEKLLQELRAQLNSMSTHCDKLQTDNQTLLTKLHGQEETIKRDQETRGKNVENVQLEEDLELAEKELEEVKDENKDLQSQIMEMKNEMDEMYDHFRENEHEEFRELQKELDLTAKNCRILQFKLRKSERRNDQIEEDRVHYEEKLRQLQDQFDSQDAKHHIRVLEEELRVAKEVSVRLHDELDIVEDRRNKALEENRHLTELLEHTDKRQFRLEMEIDKLRDVVSDLKMQLREAKGGNNKDSSPDKKVSSYIYTRSILD